MAILFSYSTFFLYLFIDLGPEFLDSEAQPSPNGSSRYFHTNLGWGQGWKPTCENFYLPPLKNLAGKTSNLLELLSVVDESLVRFCSWLDLAQKWLESWLSHHPMTQLDYKFLWLKVATCNVDGRWFAAEMVISVLGYFVFWSYKPTAYLYRIILVLFWCELWIN